MEPRVLGGEVARSRARLLDEPAAVGEHGRHDRARDETAQRHLEPVTRRRAAVVPQQLHALRRSSRPRDRGRRRCRSPRPRGRGPLRGAIAPTSSGRTSPPSVVTTRTGSAFLVARLVIGIAPFAIAELRAAVVVEVRPRHAPAGERPAERADEVRPGVRERLVPHGCGRRRGAGRGSSSRTGRRVRRRRSRRPRSPCPRSGRRRRAPSPARPVGSRDRPSPGG